MPVYYDEKDERKEFIKNTINNLPVAVDTGCFASYLYKDVGYENLKLEYAEYDKMMEIITNRFPRLDRIQVLKEVFSTIVDVEQEYIKAWMSKENPSLSEKLRIGLADGTVTENSNYGYGFWSDC